MIRVQPNSQTWICFNWIRNRSTNDNIIICTKRNNHHMHSLLHMWNSKEFQSSNHTSINCSCFRLMISLWQCLSSFVYRCRQITLSPFFSICWTNEPFGSIWTDWFPPCHRVAMHKRKTITWLMIIISERSNLIYVTWQNATRFFDEFVEVLNIYI